VARINLQTQHPQTPFNFRLPAPVLGRGPAVLGFRALRSARPDTRPTCVENSGACRNALQPHSGLPAGTSGNLYVSRNRAGKTRTSRVKQLLVQTLKITPRSFYWIPISLYVSCLAQCSTISTWNDTFAGSAVSVDPVTLRNWINPERSPNDSVERFGKPTIQFTYPNEPFPAQVTSGNYIPVDKIIAYVSYDSETTNVAPGITRLFVRGFLSTTLLFYRGRLKFAYVTDMRRSDPDDPWTYGPKTSETVRAYGRPNEGERWPFGACANEYYAVNVQKRLPASGTCYWSSSNFHETLARARYFELIGNDYTPISGSLELN